MILYYKLITYFDLELGLGKYCAISNPCINCIVARDQCLSLNSEGNVLLRCYSLVW